jgi:protein TonB
MQSGRLPAPAPQEFSVDYAQQQRNPSKHLTSIGIVLALHLLVGWALVSGLARKVVEVIKSPIETKIIEEVKTPPPPPENLPPPPKMAPPPPSFVPPPEVVVQAPPQNAPTITTTTVRPPDQPVRVAPPAPAAPPAPPAPPARVAPQLNFNACEKPEYTTAARRSEAQGTVVVLYTMDVDGRITEASVEKSSGPTREHKQLDRATLEAVKACKGRPGMVDGKPERLSGRVEYVWKLVD